VIAYLILTPIQKYRVAPAAIDPESDAVNVPAACESVQPAASGRVETNVRLLESTSVMLEIVAAAEPAAFVTASL
jgi:hypothetical protein